MILQFQFGYRLWTRSLYEYLVNDFKWQYKGIDLNKKLIKNANKIHNCELFFEEI